MLALLEFARTWSVVAVWFWFTLLIGLIWLRRHLDLNRARRQPQLTAADAAGDPATLPPLTFLVAARDEEPNIGACLDGMRRQAYPQLKIVAVNDRSDDRTGAIIDAAATADPRVTPVHVQTAWEGWFGKHNAMREGLTHADTDWFCFTDADCRFHDPNLLAAAMRLAEREQIDFLSVLPQLDAPSFWEKVVQPPAGAIMVFWYPPEKVNNPAKPQAYANGAFMLMRRSCYEAIGGHAAVKQTLNEDMHMARRAKAAGQKLHVIQGGDLYSVRMYAGLRQIWRGWTRIFYGCFSSIARLTLSALVLLLFSVSPYLTLLAGLLVGGATGYGLAAAAGVAIVAQQTVMWRFYRVCGFPPPVALAYPLGAAVCVGMMVAALTRYMGVKTEWRGTQYVGGAKGR